jgi:hypothetical protein
MVPTPSKLFSKISAAETEEFFLYLKISIEDDRIFCLSNDAYALIVDYSLKVSFKSEVRDAEAACAAEFEDPDEAAFLDAEALFDKLEAFPFDELFIRLLV